MTHPVPHNVSNTTTITSPVENKIADGLRQGKFFWMIEFVVSSAHELSEDIDKVDSYVQELGDHKRVISSQLSRDPDATHHPGHRIFRG